MDLGTSKSRTKVSYVLLAYNQITFIEDAVLSALEQSYEDIEFILSDDCSLDGTWENMQRAADGSKRNVILNQMPDNVGLVPHLNYCLSICTGDIIVLAAGDDIAMVDRVQKSVACLTGSVASFQVTFSDTIIDAEGCVLNSSEAALAGGYYDVRTALASPILFPGASRAMRREVFDVFGPLLEECTTEDTPFFLRALYLGGCTLSNDAGIFYRKTEHSLSSAKGMKTHNPLNLERQYEADLLVARTQGLVSVSEEKLIRKWMEFRNIQKRYSQTRGAFKRVIYLFLSAFRNSYFRRYIISKVF